MSTLEVSASMEADLDNRIEALISKMVAGKATPQEKAEYQELLEQRTKMMRSPVLARLQKMRRLRRTKSTAKYRRSVVA